MFNPFEFNPFPKKEKEGVTYAGSYPHIKMMTEYEALIEIYNNCQRSIVLDKANIAFFTAKAQIFKKDSPDYKNAMSKVKELETSLYYYQILLREEIKLIESSK